MLFTDFLEEAGMTPSGVSRVLDISRQAVSKWVEVPPDWMVKLQPILDAARVQRELDEKLGNLPRKPLSELSELELLTWIRCRSRIEGGDYEICQMLECKPWEFLYAINELVKKYPVSDKFWKQVKSDSDVRK